MSSENGPDISMGIKHKYVSFHLPQIVMLPLKLMSLKKKQGENS